MVTHSRHRIHFAVSAILSLSLVLLFCGKDSLFNKPEPQEYGNVAPVLLFKKGARTLATVPQGVKDIRLRIMRGTAVDTSLTVPYSAHQAEIDHIPVGDVLLTVDGLDSLGQAMDTGSVLVSIAANVIAQPVVNLISTHPIVLIFTSPRNNDTLASKSVTLSGSIVAEYGLLTFTMGQSGVSVDGDQWSRNADLADGINQFVFVAVDNKGNFLRDTLTVFYSATAHDLTGPVITLVQPADSSTVPLTPITITGTATDPSGILAVQVNTKTATLSGSSFSISQDLVPGPNKIIVTAIDNSPTQNKSSDTFFVTLNTASKDTIGPSVTINTPKDGDTVASATVMISGTASDISGLASVTVNGAVATITNSVWSASIPVTAGPNKIVVIATDASPQHNVARDTITIVYNATAQDKTLPSVAITSPSNNTVVSNPLNIAIAGTASDPAGIASVKVNGLSAVYASGSWSASVTLSHAGNNAVWAVATDNAGNRDSTSVNLIYDSTAADVIPPSIILVSHTKGQTVSVSPVLIQVTATDANGINWVTINGDTAALNAGKYEKSIPLVNGVNQIKVVAQDKSTNRNVDSLKFTLTLDPSAADSTPPQIALASLTSGQVVSSRSVLIQVTATDANGIAWVTIRGDTAALDAGRYEKTEVLTNGSNTIRVVAQDASSRKNLDTLVFTLTCDTTAADNTPPQIALVSPTAGQKVASLSQLIVVNVTDQSGVASVTIAGRPASIVNSNYQAQVTLAQGSNAISVSAADASANRNTALQTFTVVCDTTLTDSTPPKISLVSPADSQVMTAKTVTLRLTATDANGISLVTLNGDTVPLNGTQYNAIKTLSPGANPFKVYATDASANHNRSVLNFTLFYDSTAADTTPPAITLTSPSNGQAVTTATVSVQGTATDANGIFSVTVNNNAATVNGNNYSYSMTLSPGNNPITIVATDASKNRNRATLGASVILLPPAPVLVYPPNSATGQPFSLKVGWNSVAQVQTYWLQVAGDAGFSIITINDSTLTDSLKALNGLTAGATYYWRVKAKNPGGWGNWSSAFSFAVTRTPVVPVLISPTDGSKNQQSSVTLTWNQASGAKVYYINVWATTAGQSFLKVDSTVTQADTQYTAIVPIGSVDYKWTVRAKNGDSLSDWATAWAFSTGSIMPQVPTLKSPADGATHLFIPTSVSWNAAVGALSYHVQVSTDASFASGDSDYAGVAGTSYTLRNLSVNTTYYWHVYATNGDSSTVWSSIRSFTTVLAAPGAPVLKSPSNGTTMQNTTVTLTWLKPDTTVTAYWVQVSTHSDFSTPDVLNQTSLTTESTTLTGLAKGQTYYWRVLASNHDASSDWSAPWSFTVPLLSWTASSTGLTDANVMCLAASGSNIFAGTVSGGVFLSTNNGQSWQAVNNGLTTAYVSCFAMNGSNLFAGTNGGGVFRSTNNGQNWTPVDSGLASPGVMSLTVSGGNVIAGTGDGTIYQSTNNGTSWTQVNYGLTNTIWALMESSIGTFAGTNTDGIFQSTNNGTTWTVVNSGLTNTCVRSLAANGNNIFAGTNGGGVFLSNNGTNWNAVNSGLSDQIVLSLLVNSNNIFAGTGSSGVFMSTDNGGNWVAASSGLPGGGSEVMAFTVSGATLFAGLYGGGVYTSPLP